MLTGLLSFLGVVIGASLQYLFTRHIENQRHIRELKSKAYMDYLQCVSEQAQLRPSKSSSEGRILLSRIADSKTRICLYGSNEAISSFSRFEELGATMASHEGREAFTFMVGVMRKDSGSKTDTSPKDIQNILLGTHN